MTQALPLAWRLAGRELRGGLRGFRIFLACLVVGVATIAGVGSIAASIVAGLKADARVLLGGDVELRLVHRPMTAEQRDYVAQAPGTAAVSDTVEMRAMTRTPDGSKRSLIELKALDAAYPLYGRLSLAPDGVDREAALGRGNDGAWGAAVDPALLDRLGLKLGDRIRIGEGEFAVRATIVREPDLANAFILGPRVMIAADALPETKLIQPGTLVSYIYRIRLSPPGRDTAPWIGELKARFPDAGWRVRDFGDAAPSVQRFLDRIAMFLTLVGLTALLVGGVGIGNAVRSYLGGKTETIATLKCLGAPSALILRVYLAQILALAALGIVVGLAIGAAAPIGVNALFADKLPVAARIGLYPEPLSLAAAFGVLVTLAFSLWPLGRAREVPAASLFRDVVAPQAGGRPHPAIAAAIVATAVALAALAILSADDRRLATWFVAGAAGALLAFRFAAAAVIAMARHAGRPRHTGLRLAIANLHRPGAPTGSVVLSLGLGLTVLVAVALIDGNLLRQIQERLPENAPTYFFIDIQPDQVAGFDAIVNAVPGVTGVERVPSLRGRISKLNGVPVEQAPVAPEAQWAIRSERGLTYAAKPPAGSHIAEGEWWPADYKGPPLVSFDAELAHGMGLKVGDTITINVLGREVTATIANLRAIDWTSLGINFTLIFAPGTLEHAPQTFIAAAHATPAAEGPLQREVTDRFPNVSAIRVKDALDAVARIFNGVGTAVRVTAGIAILAGTLVLAGAIAAGHRRRVYDAVVLKVLGATRGDVTRAFLIEYGLLGLVTAAIAGVLGTVAAYEVVTRLMRADWEFVPMAVLGTAVLSTTLTIVLGFAGTWRALGAKAAPLLRNE
ncbi:MAG TPA: FtsX-like permease family protein [Stellaceae bacterium]